MADDDMTPTVEDVIADGLPHHENCTEWEVKGDDFWCWCKPYRRKYAAAAVAAVRAMSVPQQAQLIGGKTERRGWTVDGYPRPVAEGEAYGGSVDVRVVGPWRTEP